VYAHTWYPPRLLLQQQSVTMSQCAFFTGYGTPPTGCFSSSRVSQCHNALSSQDTVPPTGCFSSSRVSQCHNALSSQDTVPPTGCFSSSRVSTHTAHYTTVIRFLHACSKKYHLQKYSSQAAGINNTFIWHHLTPLLTHLTPLDKTKTYLNTT
jgi:hypothetical protein